MLYYIKFDGKSIGFMKKIIIICMYILLFETVWADKTYTFQTKNEGLHTLSISAIVQDAEGFLWFGTTEGISMYDGKEFVPYTSIPFQRNSLASIVVQTMLMEDNGEILWIGTYAGLDCYNIATKTFSHYTVSDDVVVSLLIDSKGRFWAGTLNGLTLLNRETGKIKIYNSTKDSTTGYIGNNTIRNLYEDSKGIIYAATYDGLFEYDETTDTFVKSRLLKKGNPASNGTVYDVYEDADGTYWISSWMDNGGLIKVDGETKDFTVFTLPDNRIYTMNFDFDAKSILLGSWGSGLYVFDKKTGETVQYSIDSPSPSNLCNNTIYSLFKDSNGILWIGTNGGGLNVYDPSRSMFKSVTTDSQGNRIPQGRTRGIQRDVQGNIWVGIINSGVSKYNPDTQEITVYRHHPDNSKSLISDMVNFLYIDSKQKIWIGTNNGLASYNEKDDSFTHEKWFQDIEKTLEQKHVYSMIEDTDGSLWIGTYNNGITHYYPDSGLFEQYKHDPDNPNSLSNNLIYFLGLDSKNNLWIGTNNGLNLFFRNTKTFKTFQYNIDNSRGISANTIFGFVEDSQKNVWFASRAGGLSVLSHDWTPETADYCFTHYTTNMGLSSNTINAIASATPDKIWAATQNGLSLIDAQSKVITTYSQNDGLLSQQFNLGAATTAQGDIYFGTPEGLICFNGIESSKQLIKVPKVAITTFVVNSVPIETLHSDFGKKQIILKPIENNIEIGFTSMDFSPLNRPLYTYKLDGFDEDWTVCGMRNYVSYTNLKPGNYTFQVKNYISDPLIENDETNFSFHIPTPLFQRWYMYVLYAVGIGLLFYLFIRVRDVLQLRKKIQELEQAKIYLESANGELQNLSYNDELTAIPNRRFFETIISRTWESCLLRNEPLAICMIDIDFFKNFNDTYGHPEGDSALRLVAAAIKQCIHRNGDIVARYGGEEFVVMFSNMSSYNAFNIAEKIREAVRDIHLPAAFGSENFLTISIGIFAEVPSGTIPYTEFISRADKALYCSKMNGRNCVTVTKP